MIVNCGQTAAGVLRTDCGPPRTNAGCIFHGSQSYRTPFGGRHVEICITRFAYLRYTSVSISQDLTSEDDPESSEADEMEMANAELEKLLKGFEHGSSKNTRGRAGRRDDMDEVSGIGALVIVLVAFTANEHLAFFYRGHHVFEAL